MDILSGKIETGKATWYCENHFAVAKIYNLRETENIVVCYCVAPSFISYVNEGAIFSGTYQVADIPKVLKQKSKIF